MCIEYTCLKFSLMFSGMKPNITLRVSMSCVNLLTSSLLILEIMVFQDTNDSLCDGPQNGMLLEMLLSQPLLFLILNSVS